METEDRLTALELRAKGLNTRMNKVWDWISTHDERMAKADSLIELAKAKVEDARTWWHNQPIEPKPREPLKDGVPCDHPGCLAHLTHPCEGCGRIGGKPSIEQELEDGLERHKWAGESCTYILLPTAQWEEYCEPDSPMGANPAPTFHDIPVFGLPIDRIIYGTD